MPFYPVILIVSAKHIVENIVDVFDQLHWAPFSVWLNLLIINESDFKPLLDSYGGISS